MKNFTLKIFLNLFVFALIFSTSCYNPTTGGSFIRFHVPDNRLPLAVPPLGQGSLSVQNDTGKWLDVNIYSADSFGNIITTATPILRSFGLDMNNNFYNINLNPGVYRVVVTDHFDTTLVYLDVAEQVFDGFDTYFDVTPIGIPQTTTSQLVIENHTGELLAIEVDGNIVDSSLEAGTTAQYFIAPNKFHSLRIVQVDLGKILYSEDGIFFASGNALTRTVFSEDPVVQINNTMLPISGPPKVDSECITAYLDGVAITGSICPGNSFSFTASHIAHTLEIQGNSTGVVYYDQSVLFPENYTTAIDVD